jgi:lipopolysaccharide transport system ATP-binding protein
VARLGFACAISTQPDILLLDEVLAVGDMNFRRKCLERLFEMRATGMSLVMVHHSPGILLSIAETALYLRRGKVIDLGEASKVIQQYERDLIKDMPASAGAGQSADAADAFASGDAEIIDVLVESSASNAMTSGEDAMIHAHFKIKRPIGQVNFTATIFRLPSLESIKNDEKPRPVLKMVSRRDGGSISNVEPGEYEVRIELPAVGLRDGVYQIGLRLSCPPRTMLASRSSMSFLVSSKDVTPGEYHQRRTWSVISRDGCRLQTEKVLHSEEDLDDLMGLDESR